MNHYNVELWRFCPSDERPKRGPDRNLFVDAEDADEALGAAVVYFDLVEEAETRPQGKYLVHRVSETNSLGVSASEILSPQAAPVAATASSGAGGPGGKPRKG